MSELVTTSNNSNIEIKTIELETGEKKYEIRKRITGSTGIHILSLSEYEAKALYLLLGKEFGYLPEDTSVESQEAGRNSIKTAFFLDDNQIERITISDTILTTKEFLKNINAAVDRKIMKPLSITLVNRWLVKNGYLKEEKRPAIINKTFRVLSDKSAEIGITEKVVVDSSTGEVLHSEIAFDSNAQRFILNHLVEIIGN